MMPHALMACSTMSKHVVIAWTHYAFILDMSSWMLYCILGNTTMDACSFCSKFCTYKLCLISKYTVVNCEIYVTNTTAYLSLTSNNAFIYQAIYIKHSSIRLYIKQGIHPSGYTLNRTFIYQISQGHLACGSRSSGGGLLLPMQMPGPSTISFPMRRSRSSIGKQAAVSSLRTCSVQMSHASLY